MSEYIAVAAQEVLLNQAAVFDASIPCRNGLVFHEDGSGIFLLRGIVRSPYINWARYSVIFNGNIALPEGGTAGPIAVALAINGEPRAASLAIATPAAVQEFFNVTSTATIIVPRGASFSVSLRHVAASADPAVTPAPVITLQNANLRIERTA